MNARIAHPLNSTHRRRWILRIGGMILIVLVAVLILAKYSKYDLFSGPALTELVISGSLSHVNPQAVRAAVLPKLGKGFFSTRVAQIQAAVQAVPWVASAAVRRSWPHTLHVDITEDVPVARWNGTGLMDAEGHVFTQSTAETWNKLPMLSGSPGHELDVLTEFKALTSVLNGSRLAIEHLTVDARDDSTVVLNNGIKVRLGRADAKRRLERFTTVALPVLSSKISAVAYVDMRYTNGFAVGWNSPGVSSACRHTLANSQVTCAAPAAGQIQEVGPHV